MRLIIAEKPSQARSIAKALSVNRKSTDGAIEGDGTTISWCIGHLVTLAMPEDYDPRFKSWNPGDLPIIPEKTKLIPTSNSKKQWQVVKRLLNSKNFSEIVNATDSGREGELIFDNVYQLSGSQTPVKRLWTASLTDGAIREAFKNLRPASEFEGLRDAARCRAEADWIIGLNATRLETLSARSLGKNNGVYPVGRVQTPTLAMIVNRESEIIKFEPKNYWTLEALFEQEDKNYKGTWFLGDRSRFDMESKAEQIRSKIIGKPGSIENFQEKEERKKSPLLYDLTTLQREANVKLGLTAEKALNICQSLYENHKILSYPRTNSRYLTPGEASELPSMLDKLETVGPYKPLIQAKNYEEIPKRFVNEKKVEDHHAIIPTGEIPTNGLSDDEKRIFDMVFRRTLAAFYNDRIDFVTKIETKVEGELFRTKGRIMRQPGWWAVNPMSSKEDKDIVLPPIDKNISVVATNVTTKKGVTTPPPRYSEASLLQRMETAGKDIDDEELKEAMKEGGLGTPATRASIIEGLKKRELILVKGKTLVPSPKGTNLINQIPDGPLKSTAMTGEWELKLNKMVRGEYSRNEFMTEIKELTKSLVAARRDDIRVPSQESREVGSCPKCDEKLLLRQFKADHYVKCVGTDCGLAYSSDSSGKPSGGNCNQEGCSGPVTKTKKGSLLCVLCEKWQDAAPPQSLGNCPKCKADRLELKSYQGKHYAKCPDCNLAYDTDKNGRSKGGSCKKCKGPVRVTKAKSKVCAVCGQWQSPPPRGRNECA